MTTAEASSVSQNQQVNNSFIPSFRIGYDPELSRPRQERTPNINTTLSALIPETDGDKQNTVVNTIRYIPLNGEEIKAEAKVFQNDITHELDRVEQELDLQFPRLFPKYSKSVLAPENLMNEIQIDVQLLKIRIEEYRERGVSDEVIAPAILRLRLAEKILQNKGYTNRAERKEVLKERVSLKTDFNKQKFDVDNFKYLHKIVVKSEAVEAKRPEATVQVQKPRVAVIPALLKAIISMKPRRVSAKQAHVLVQQSFIPQIMQNQTKQEKLNRKNDAALTMRVLKAIFGTQDNKPVLTY